MIKRTAILLVAGAGVTAHAGGFLLNEFDAKAVGRGNATTATDVDPSSIYYNVGGLAAGVDGTQAMISGSLVSPQASFTDATTNEKTDANASTAFVPGVFVSHRMTSMFAIGIGFYTPFGLSVSWPTSSAQAEVAQDVTLRTYFITPAVGANLGSFVPGLSVGAGIDLVPATLELKQQIPFGTDPPGNAHLGANAVGIGGRIGVMYKPNSMRQLSLGAMWRSDVKEDFSGTGNFNVDASTPQFRSLLPPDGNIKTSITLPQSVSAGVGYRATDSLELETDVVWANWSKFKQLDIQTPSATVPMSTMTIHQVTAYDDTVSVRVGAEYAFPWVGAAVRAGFIFDPSPVPSAHLTAQVPDIDRYDVTLGGTKTIGDYAVHLGLLWVLPGNRKTAGGTFTDPMNTPEQKGTFDVTAFVATVTLQGHFGPAH
jgi:long-chain fatty acid transport protein